MHDEAFIFSHFLMIACRSTGKFKENSFKNYNKCHRE